MAVIDEHGRQAGFAERRRQPADIATIATRDQRQQTDGGVFGGMEDPGMRESSIPLAANSSGVIVYITAVVGSTRSGISNSMKSMTSPEVARRR